VRSTCRNASLVQLSSNACSMVHRNVVTNTHTWCMVYVLHMVCGGIGRGGMGRGGMWQCVMHQLTSSPPSHVAMHPSHRSATYTKRHHLCIQVALKLHSQLLDFKNFNHGWVGSHSNAVSVGWQLRAPKICFLGYTARVHGMPARDNVTNQARTHSPLDVIAIFCEAVVKSKSCRSSMRRR